MVMEAALVGVATGALKPVLGKLGTLLGDEYTRFKGVRKEIKPLTHELAAMEAFLLRMSEVEDPDVQDKVWMNEVRELSYDMEDAIDDFMQSVDHKDEKTDGFIEKIKSSLGKLGKLNFRLRSGRDIQHLKKQIIEVGVRNARYRTDLAISSSKNAAVDPRALAIFEHASKLVGIDEPKAEIIELLTREDGRTSAEEPLKVVSIVGSGGTGKTTLAYQVYQDLKGKFDRSAFLSVSRNPDMIYIVRTIHSQVSHQEYFKTEAANVQQVIINISNFLADKRTNCVRLFQLRYLNLESTTISKLPEQIERLGFLEMLDLRDTCVEELPTSIVNLGKLSHLLVDNYVKFPDGIAKMQALETLEDVRVSIQPFDFLWGLGQLKNLRNLQLDLRFEVDSDTEDTYVVEECSKAILSSLCKLGTQNLRSLTIYGGSSLLQEPLCLPTLEKLITRSSAISQVPTWVSSLRNLKLLCLTVKGIKKSDLRFLGALPALLILHLEEVTRSNEKIRISGEVRFQILRIFIYDAHYKPVDLMFGAGSMPKLVKLVLKSLYEVEAGGLDFGIENLPSLTTVKCEVLGGDGIVGAIKTAMKRAANTHPNRPSIVA